MSRGGSSVIKTDQSARPGAVRKRQWPRGLAATNSLLLPLVGLLLLGIFFALLAPNFVTLGNLYNILREASVLLIVSVGVTYVILMGSIDLSVGQVVTLSGLATALALQTNPLPLAVAVGVMCGILVGAINGALFAYGKVPSFLVTLGMSLVLTGIALWLVGGRPVQINNDEFRWLSTGTPVLAIPNVAVWALIVYGIGIVVAARTRFGRFMYALGGGEAVAKLSGVPVRRFKLYAMIVSGALAGLAGVLLSARIGAATPSMGDSLVLPSIASVVMGGTALTGGAGGVHRTLLGVLVITVLRNGLDIMAVGPYVQLIAQGVVVILAVAVTLDRRKISILK